MVHVAVLGGAGGIGQPLSLLLKISPLVTKLSVYDIVRSIGVGADLSHICTNSNVSAHEGADSLHDALKGAQVVVIPAGVPRKPGMTRDDLFNINASIVRDLAQGIAEVCPKAIVCIISNPVNSMVPIACEVLRKNNVYDPRKVFGVTTLDTVRALRFLHEANEQFDSRDGRVVVIGGHSGNTIVPLLSSAKPKVEMTEEQVKAMTHRVQFGGDEVVKAKAGAGSATLSMAYAGYLFVTAVIKGMKGEESVMCTYVNLSADAEGAKDIKNHGVVDVEYFSVPVKFGAEGVESILPLPALNDYERELLKEAVAPVVSNIEAGVQFAKK